jgi:hypothetical protein
MKARSVSRLAALCGVVLSVGVGSGCAATPEEPRTADPKAEGKDAPREAIEAREGTWGAFRPGPELERLRRHLREAEEAGREEEADEIRGRIAVIERERLAREEGRPAPVAPERLERLQRKIDELHQAGRHDEAQRLERQSDRARGGLADRRDGEPGGAVEAELQRRQHVREAIEHLHAAGMHDIAERLERQADRMRRELEALGTRRRAEPEMREGERLGHHDRSVLASG